MIALHWISFSVYLSVIASYPLYHLSMTVEHRLNFRPERKSLCWNQYNAVRPKRRSIVAAENFVRTAALKIVLVDKLSVHQKKIAAHLVCIFFKNPRQDIKWNDLELRRWILVKSPVCLFLWLHNIFKILWGVVFLHITSIMRNMSDIWFFAKISKNPLSHPTTIHWVFSQLTHCSIWLIS